MEFGEQAKVRVTAHQGPQPRRRFTVDSHQLVQCTDCGELGNEVQFVQGLLDRRGNVRRVLQRVGLALKAGLPDGLDERAAESSSSSVSTAR